MSSGPLLELLGVTTTVLKDHRRVPVILDVSFAIRRGEIVGLVGESGSGKSMTARTVFRSLPPRATTEGEILLNGQDVMKMSAVQLREARARSIGVIFQDPRSGVDPLWTVEDHITEGMRVHRGLTRTEAREEAIDLLGQVGIRDASRRLRQYPGELSGGLLQRVVIAGTLAAKPELIIADEPTTALDVTTQSEIVALLSSLRRDRGLAMLFITHDLTLAASICDRIMVMYAGRIVEAQSHQGILTHPAHPYTRGLVAARPTIEARQERLEVISGVPTSAADAPSGCAFHPRCRFAQERCRTLVPPLAEVDNGLSACLRNAEIHDELDV